MEWQGTVPSSGLIVCNHLSYLDVIAFSALRPCVFVAKSEVASWPVFGWVAQAAGTIFVDRSRKAGAARSESEIRTAICAGLVVVLFAEGTSSDGTTVLPFKSALLEPAVQLNCPVTAAAINYSLGDNGSVADEICYWRDMNFLPHLWNLCRKSFIAGTLAFTSIPKLDLNRKQLADCCTGTCGSYGAVESR